MLVAPILFLSPTVLNAKERGPVAMPPAKVVIAGVTSGMVAPQSNFVGTVFYQEISDVASEANGMVEGVSIEEGEEIEKGEVLVKLNQDLLQKTIQATRASYEEMVSDLEKAKIDFKRVDSLFREKLVSEQEYDEHRFIVRGKELKAESLKAEVERLEVELKRIVIRAPFGGVVLKRHADVGEWLSAGSPVATIARSDAVDIVVNVPEEVLRSIQTDQPVRIKSGGKEIRGKVSAIIPKGDIPTRTFPVKIRVENNRSLFEGMEARVTLPAGRKRKSFLVPRDAVMTVSGSTLIFAVVDLKAVMIPVKVTGYDERMAWVDSDKLQEGMKVVIKGNERLRDGQPVDLQMK